MKKLKVFIILAGILLAGILMTSSKIYAADSSANPMYLGLYNNSNARKTGFYDYLDASRVRRPAIKIVKYENAQGLQLGNVDYLTQIYCLRHGIGFGSEGSTAARVPYTQYFDMKKPETIGNEYKEAIGITAGVTPNYNKIMWILSNVANPNDPESINALFTAAGINVNDFKGDKAQMTQEEMVDILEAAQQMAIWYYTNPTGDYHPSGTNESLRVGATNQNNSKSPVVSKYYNDKITYPLNELYRYLITKSEEAVNGGYTYQTSAATINFNKDNATYVEEGSNYKFGPYNLTYTNNPGITVNIEADVQLGNNIRIVNAQGVEYPGNTVSEKILNANGADFYAVVPKSTNVKTFKIAVSANYQTTDITYWSTSANIAQRNQPVAVVQKAPKKPELKVNGTTYLSLRDLSDMLGTEIVWNSKLKRININTNSNYDAKQKTEWLEEDIQPKEEIQTGNYDISDEMLSLVNDFRAENSVPPLKKLTDMQGYANIRSKEIVEFFSHVRPNGEEGLDSVIAKSDYRTAGENIAAGNKDARSTFEQWKNSQGHRDNMLNPKFTHMTVGSCYGDGMYGYYHAQIFVGK